MHFWLFVWKDAVPHTFCKQEIGVWLLTKDRVSFSRKNLCNKVWDRTFWMIKTNILKKRKGEGSTRFSRGLLVYGIKLPPHMHIVPKHLLVFHNQSFFIWFFISKEKLSKLKLPCFQKLKILAFLSYLVTVDGWWLAQN